MDDGHRREILEFIAVQGGVDPDTLDNYIQNIPVTDDQEKPKITQLEHDTRIVEGKVILSERGQAFLNWKDTKPQRASKQSLAVEVIGLTEENVEILFSDQFRNAWAWINVDGHHETLQIGGSSCREFLSRLLWENSGKAPTGEVLNAAVNVLRAKAIYDGEVFYLKNRVARKGNALYYDLGCPDWKAVKIDAVGWSIIERTAEPIFRRFAHQAAQVEPASDAVADIDLLREIINIKDDNTWLLFKAWLVISLIEDIPRPILVLYAPKGSAKTSAARFARQLIDPSNAPINSLKGDEGEMALILDHNYVVLFDNLSSIKTEQSNLLCRGVTGDGLSKRRLYTDDEDVVFSFRRPIMTTGINVPFHLPDI